MKFSMIVEMTSLTPRFTLRTAGDRGPGRADRHGDQQDERDVQRPGQVDHAARGGRHDGRERYWPSTPMLNRFIRKPMATARPARNSGTDRLIHVRIWLDSAARGGAEVEQRLERLHRVDAERGQDDGEDDERRPARRPRPDEPVTSPRRRRFMPGSLRTCGAQAAVVGRYAAVVPARRSCSRPELLRGDGGRVERGDQPARAA